MPASLLFLLAPIALADDAPKGDQACVTPVEVKEEPCTEAPSVCRQRARKLARETTRELQCASPCEAWVTGRNLKKAGVVRVTATCELPVASLMPLPETELISDNPVLGGLARGESVPSLELFP